MIENCIYRVATNIRINKRIANTIKKQKLLLKAALHYGDDVTKRNA